MNRRKPLVPGETYHIYNRGAHKALIFKSREDYARFQILMYLANNSRPIIVRDILDQYRGPSSGGRNVFQHPVDKGLVDIFAYCLMPNHMHFVLQSKTEDGATTFMRKLFTAYSMYFNLRHAHSGTLFQGRFKSSHIDSDPYFRYIFTYVHLNPLELAEKSWKENGIASVQAARDFMLRYEYSSFLDYRKQQRPERAILTSGEVPDFLRTQDDLEELLAFYKENRPTEDGPKGGALAGSEKI